ncbi:MAG: aminoacyl-tRNA hydrolase [Candidatus Taylorbacteria bacterium CG11_big_fil_rev_8_21_14_0_20_46_11]|uniref:Peptidyl-tRNA hydrolase n=1 Tax=Candidatus Taylorbacteria bacterium CG11_big_fil_rev_8_21_14_0_20_46_11 TaxID=1975025 RepID=A0A2H0KB93_9BACT|nr:MAG: aminoacyl-tRNA hydrolase [Candidatus Taylorbacteria bacterium CG11_big_fil_rev_8_21_14_0_20_46_11]
MFYIVGLGNPGKEYENTRHNTGAMVLDVFRETYNLPEWTPEKKRNALVSEGKVGKEKVLLIFPQTFMNKSGNSVSQIKDLRFKIKDKKKQVENLVVIHDDLDIPFGSYKISFNKSSGGHHGVDSIIKVTKTQAFVRVRVGIASSASVVKKSQDEKTVEKVILGHFTPDQVKGLKKLAKNIAEGLEVLVNEGKEKAMSQYHA